MNFYFSASTLLHFHLGPLKLLGMELYCFCYFCSHIFSMRESKKTAGLKADHVIDMALLVATNRFYSGTFILRYL